MTLRFSYTRPDGGVVIVAAAPKDKLELILGPLTDVEYRAHVLARSIPTDATDVAELPIDWSPPDTDRTFRDAWRQTAGTFSIDMKHAREILRERMRAKGVTKVPEIDAAQTPDQLRLILKG